MQAERPCAKDVSSGVSGCRRAYLEADTMASIDAEAAIVLKSIPDEGATLSLLAQAAGFDPKRAEAAVERLLSLKLVEMSGDTIHITPFAQKARNLFNITA
jgi:hypothetical protein